MSSLREYIGIPFVDRGRSRAGMDCWGLVLSVLREHYGKDVPDFDVSCMDTEAIHGLYESERSRWTPVTRPEPGDVAVMRLDPEYPHKAQHVGVYVGDGRVLHTMRRRESHIIRADDPFWSKKIAEWYRWSA